MKSAGWLTRLITILTRPVPESERRGYIPQDGAIIAVFLLPIGAGLLTATVSPSWIWRVGTSFLFLFFLFLALRRVNLRVACVQGVLFGSTAGVTIWYSITSGLDAIIRRFTTEWLVTEIGSFLVIFIPLYIVLIFRVYAYSIQPYDRFYMEEHNGDGLGCVFVLFMGFLPFGLYLLLGGMTTLLHLPNPLIPASDTGVDGRFLTAFILGVYAGEDLACGMAFTHAAIAWASHANERPT